jgi:hypothetical protein
MICEAFSNTESWHVHILHILQNKHPPHFAGAKKPVHVQPVTIPDA